MFSSKSYFHFEKKYWKQHLRICLTDKKLLSCAQDYFGRALIFVLIMLPDNSFNKMGEYDILITIKNFLFITPLLHSEKSGKTFFNYQTLCYILCLNSERSFFCSAIIIEWESKCTWSYFFLWKLNVLFQFSEITQEKPGLSSL